MSILGVTAIFICMVIGFLAGILLMGVSLSLVDISINIPLLQGQFSTSQINNDLLIRFLIGVFGLFVVILCLRYLYSRIFPSKRRRAITFESPQGKIDITIFAVEDMIKKLMERHKELAHIRPTVTFKKNFVEVEVSSYLALDVNLLEFTQEIQSEIKQKLMGFLGDKNEISVKISIRKVMFSKKEAINNGKPEQEPEIPFRSY